MQAKQAPYCWAVLPALVFEFEQWLTHNIIAQLRESLLIKGRLISPMFLGQYLEGQPQTKADWKTEPLETLVCLKAPFIPHRSQKSPKIIVSLYSKGKEMLSTPVKGVNSWKITIALTYLLSGLLAAHGHHLQLRKLNIAQDKLVKKGTHPSLFSIFP